MYSILKFILNKIFVNKDFIKYQNPYFIGSEIKIVDKAIKSKKLIGPDNFIIKSEQCRFHTIGKDDIDQNEISKNNRYFTVLFFR